MARRMFSSRIINTARFLKMQPSTQALYFHLNLQADDDGIVEAYGVMRSTGFVEDDLNVLVAKGLVRVLNEDKISYIPDWLEHNQIRADRLTPSLHRDLLLQVIPEAQLVTPTIRADVKKYRENQIESTGRPMDRLSKGSIGKDNISKDNIYIKRTYPQNNTSFKQILE